MGRDNASMTHDQYRRRLISNIRCAYQKLIEARAKVAKYTAAKNKVKRAEWAGRAKSAARNLDEAFKSLPEVKAGPVDMDAMSFAKSLINSEGAG